MASQPPIVTLDELAARLVRLPARSIVGVSGFCGAGKSTLSKTLVDHVPKVVRLRGDDFLDPLRSHRRSSDWDGVERLRMREEVLLPFAAGDPVSCRPFDWSRRELGPATSLPAGELLLVDAIGIFHPDLSALFALRVWVDVGLSDALSRGIARDRRLGREHDALWREVWSPNEEDFFARFSPMDLVHFRYVPDDVHQHD